MGNAGNQDSNLRNGDGNTDKQVRNADKFGLKKECMNGNEKYRWKRGEGEISQGIILFTITFYINSLSQTR